jgi:Transposase DDE domain
MDSLSGLVQSVQALFGEWADQAAVDSNVILRQRKLSAYSLAATFILGFLRSPNASCEELAEVSAQVGPAVTPQAIDQRMHLRMADFLKRLFERSVKNQVPSDRCLAKLVDRFTDVQLLDSTTVSLPIEMAEQYAGCGGSHGGTAALKLQVRLSLKTGALDAVGIEPGRACDAKTPLQDDVPKAGALRIADLGYFDAEVLDRIDQSGAFWLSPYMTGTVFYDENGDKHANREFFAWLEANGPVIDRHVWITEDRVRCRLIAWRLPPEVAARRRRKLRAQVRRKEGKGAVPSAERLARCDWAILITNVPEELLSIEEAQVLYRARWQIELLFKRWKSQGLIDWMTDSSWIRCMVKLWARLLAALLQQWMQSRLWGRPEISLKKAWDLLSRLAYALASVWNDPDGLRRCLESIDRLAQACARQNKRKHASTFELLNDPTKNPYPLT